MKINLKQKIVAILCLCIVVAAAIVMLIDIFTEFSFGHHPVLTFAFCMAVGFGALTLTLGFMKKSSAYFFLSSIFLGLAVLYVFIIYVKLWWVCLILLVVVWTALAIFSYVSGSNKTEFALNKDENYKDYKQRRVEKAEKEAQEKEEIPEIKSFKE